MAAVFIADIQLAHTKAVFNVYIVSSLSLNKWQYTVTQKENTLYLPAGHILDNFL
jgi:hypothetical protein